MFRILLTIHIAAGTLGLIAGPIAMYVRKRRGVHTQIGTFYHWLMFVLCLSAVAMAFMHWSTSWYFLFVGVFSYSLALKGFLAVKRRGEGWLQKHIGGMLGSYIAMVTALLVVNFRHLPGHGHMPEIVVWLLPTIVGTPLIRWIQLRSRVLARQRQAKIRQEPT